VRMLLAVRAMFQDVLAYGGEHVFTNARAAQVHGVVCRWCDGRCQRMQTMEQSAVTLHAWLILVQQYL
jgi:hypothetical protein